MGIFEAIIGLTAISFCVERAVEYIFSLTPLKKIDKAMKSKMFASILVAAAVSYFSKVDVVNIFLNRTNDPTISGVIMTAVILAGGSNILSDLIKRIQVIKEVTEIKN